MTARSTITSIGPSSSSRRCRDPRAPRFDEPFGPTTTLEDASLVYEGDPLAEVGSALAAVDGVLAIGLAGTGGVSEEDGGVAIVPTW